MVAKTELQGGQIPEKKIEKEKGVEQIATIENAEIKEKIKQGEQAEAALAEKEGGEIGAPSVSAVGAGYLAQKEHREDEIEDILADDMEDAYISMPPEKQAEFKRVGEEVAHEINKEIDNPKFSIKKIIGLIKRWLKIIPGVNKFFIEQETKIKSDAISKMRHE